MNTPKFFCVRGFMKSGTNWLGSLLASHSRISVVGEYHWDEVVQPFNRILHREAVFSDPDYLQFVRSRFDEFVKSSLVARAEPGAEWIGERTPHTIVPIILRGCPVISIIRDGRDVLVSRAFHLFNEPTVHRLFERIPEMAEDLENFKANPWYFKEHPEMLLRHEVMVRESVRWWRDHLISDRDAVDRYPQLPVRFVHYEELHRDTQRVRAELFEFLGANPKEAAPIEGHLSPGFKTERPTEFLRKGAVGDWENYFTDETRRWFKEEGGEELIRQGYVESMDW